MQRSSIYLLHKPSIAIFVPNFVAMATRVAQGKFGWQHSMAHPRKPRYRRKNLADISYIDRVIANFVRKIRCHGNGSWLRENLNDTIG